MRKVFLIGSFGERNIGDDAICLSFVETLRNIHKSEILLYINAKMEYFKQRFVREKNLQIHVVSSFSEFLKAFLASEIIVVGGGDYISDYGNFLRKMKRFVKLFTLGILTRVFLKKFLMINNSFCVNTGAGLASLKIILNLASYVSTRDEYSYTLISKYVLKKVEKGFDTAVLLNYDWKKASKQLNEENITKKSIGISITPVFSNFFSKPEKDDALAIAIAEGINKLLSSIQNVDVYLLAFNSHPKEGDLMIIQKVMRRLNPLFKKRVKLIAYVGIISDFLSRFSQIDFMVCCKYHSIIFSYLLERPMLVINYHPKNAAIVNYVGLPKKALLSLREILYGKIYWALLELLDSPNQFRAKLPISEARRRALRSILNCLEHSSCV